MSADGLRRQIRMLAAEALAQGTTRDELAADLLCVTRGVSQPGHREHLDAADLALLWADLDTYAAPPAFPVIDSSSGSPPG